MRIFLAGATGVIGVRLLPLMLAEGHVVAAMTRTPEKINGLRAAGAIPVLCDLFASEVADRGGRRLSTRCHRSSGHRLTRRDRKAPQFEAATNRVRSEGTRNPLAAAQIVNASGFVAQSIAWGGGPVIEAHENAVTSAGGTVLRYGRFYGPGTYYEIDSPPAPRIHVDEAARRTMPFLVGPRGTFTIVDDSPVS